MEQGCKAEGVLGQLGAYVFGLAHPAASSQKRLWKSLAILRRLRQWTPRHANSPTLSKLLLAAALAVFGRSRLLLSAEDSINAALLSNDAKPLTVELPSGKSPIWCDIC
jgi:hypothetical protein